MIVGRRFRAPSQNGAILVEPGFAEVGAMLERNRQRLQQGHFAGRSMAEWRDRARRAIAGHSRSLIVSGHQPEFVHPGVWAKHFALAGLARTHQTASLNLIVDTDTVKSTSLQLPNWHPNAAPSTIELAQVMFDDNLGEIPFEDRPILNPERFQSFPDQLRPLVRDWPAEPLAQSTWPKIMPIGARNLGQMAVRARKCWEREWANVDHPEIEISQIAEQPIFAEWLGGILADLPRFVIVFNRAVHAYRRLHKLRSKNHPVPDLTSMNDGIEAPFWIWRTDQPRRNRLFVKHLPNGFELRCEQGSVHWHPAEPLPVGWKIRPRALMTTFFARLFLADLFIHGIGGGKYDEVTDAIMAEYLDIEPPEFLVLSATLHLPLPGFPHHHSDTRSEVQQLRDWYWNPQRHADSQDAAYRALVDEKQRWIEHQPADKAGRRERFRRLQALTVDLRRWIEADLHHLERELAQSRIEAQANRVLQRRDFSFLMYPEATIRPFMLAFTTSVS